MQMPPEVLAEFARQAAAHGWRTSDSPMMLAQDVGEGVMRQLVVASSDAATEPKAWLARYFPGARVVSCANSGTVYHVFIPFGRLRWRVRAEESCRLLVSLLCALFCFLFAYHHHGHARARL